ncbi:hypothetical protein [uncultured Alistipes sp.]|uniref:hypothetical protein n=1 Tax=uncultured Alistipes sp. TaxID=538949 RepID=UPI0025E182DE|nr:hypothetical protein [uncultured Alistipes sp.]
MKIIKKTEDTQRIYDNAGNTTQRTIGATYDIKLNDGRCLGSATVYDGGSANIQFSGSEGGAEATMALIENIFGNFNEQQ